VLLPGLPAVAWLQIKQYLKAGTVKLPEEIEEEKAAAAAAGGGAAAAAPKPLAAQQKEAFAFL
jgi:hypothetical protein